MHQPTLKGGQARDCDQDNGDSCLDVKDSLDKVIEE
jgi:hypothetical protein